MSLGDKYKGADSVLYGYIVGVSDSNTLALAPENKLDTDILHDFRIIETFKGPLKNREVELSFMKNSTCGLPVERNIKLILFTHTNVRGNLEASRCSFFLGQKYEDEDGKLYGPSDYELEAVFETLRSMPNKF